MNFAAPEPSQLLLPLVAAISRDGFALIPGVYASDEVAQIRDALASSLSGGGAESKRSRSGAPVAARNVLEHYPSAQGIWRREPLASLLATVLGPDFGLVRTLYFDKPPDRSWSLAWHKDLAIAVRDNGLASSVFTKPTVKAGVPHVEAPRELLEQMLTLRIHLDDVTDENGPLKLIPGSHRVGKEAVGVDCHAHVAQAQAGDVLAMRPLVSHSSGASAPGCRRHRRVLHLEFAGPRELVDGYQWHAFVS